MNNNNNNICNQFMLCTGLGSPGLDPCILTTIRSWGGMWLGWVGVRGSGVGLLGAVWAFVPSVILIYANRCMDKYEESVNHSMAKCADLFELMNFYCCCQWAVV